MTGRPTATTVLAIPVIIAVGWLLLWIGSTVVNCYDRGGTPVRGIVGYECVEERE